MVEKLDENGEVIGYLDKTGTFVAKEDADEDLKNVTITISDFDADSFKYDDEGNLEEATKTFAEIEGGNYKVIETNHDIDGYRFEETQSVTETGVITISGGNGGVAEIKDVYTELGDLVITKTVSGGITKTEAEGALTFVVEKLDENGEVVGYLDKTGTFVAKEDADEDLKNVTITISDFDEETFEYDEDGNLEKATKTFEGIEAGTYKVIETNSEIDGYRFEETQSVTNAETTVTKDEAGAAEIIDAYTELTGLVIKKTIEGGITKTEAEGALTFVVEKLDENGEVIGYLDKTGTFVAKEDADEDLKNVTITISDFDADSFKYDDEGNLEEATKTFAEIEGGNYKVIETNHDIDGYRFEETQSVTETGVITISGENGGVAEIKDVYTEFGNLEITKTVSGGVTKEEAEGALKFEIRKVDEEGNIIGYLDKDGNVVTAKTVLTVADFDEINTDEDGNITSIVKHYEDIEAGTYKVVETNTTIEGYRFEEELSVTEAETTVTKDTAGAAELKDVYTVSEVPLTEARVEKVWNDSNDQDGRRPASLTVQLLADGNPVEGAEVQLSTENGWTSGIANLLKYREGTEEEIVYTWTEKDLPAGYTLVSTDKTGTLTTLTNSYTTETTEATIRKVWNDNNNADGKRPLVLYATLSNGQTVTLTEENNWTETIEGLPKYQNGNEIEYTWSEVTVPGYTLASVTTVGTETTLVNSITSVKVSKVDVVSGEELEGATIQILDKDGNVVEEWTSTKEAHEITGLTPGETYTLRETVAPEGYKVTTDTTFTMDEDGKVTSTGSTTTDENGNTVLLVEDAKTEIHVSKVDIASGEELEGATIQILDKDGNVVEEWTSTKEAHVITGLNTGETYTLRETVAPEGYNVTTDTTFTIDETGKVTYSGSTTTDENGNTVLLVEDARNEIHVSKVDIASGEELEGAHIQILDKDGNVVEEWDSTKEAHVITGLKSGEEYTLRETVAPEGYAITTDTTFTIDETGKVTYTGTTTTDENGNTVLLVEDAKTEIRVSKTDIDAGDELEGAHIQILDKDGNVVEEWDSTDEAHVVTGLKTSETYTLKETVAPDGYTITSETTFTIDETGKVTYSGTTTTDENGNTVLLVEDAATEVRVSKVDIDSGEELEGAHIQILDEDGNVVVEWDSTKVVHEVMGLKTGVTYTLKETVAPEGYKITAETTFTIDETGKVTYSGTTTTDENGNIVMLVQDSKKDESGSLQVTKHLTTEEGEIFARDQVFYVQLFYDEECTEPASEILPLEFKNASASTVTFEGLEPGRTYYVKEVNAEGEPIEVGTVNDKVFVVNFENNEVTISTDANGTQRVEFNNEFVEIPDGFYRNGEIEVTKNVLTSAGAAKNSNETFYVGFFDDKELTQLSEVVEYPILALEMGGGSTVTNSTKIQVAPGKSYTLYVAEVDEDGNPVSNSPSFAYTVTTDKDSVTITEESLKASVTITNKEKGVTVTPTSGPTATPTTPGPARTGDDTNYEMYLALLGLAALMMAVVAYRRRREEEK